MTPTRHLGWTTLALLALTGCDVGVQTGPPTQLTPAPGTTAPTAPSNENKALPIDPGKPGAAVETLSDKEIAQVKKLPADDQAAALAQVKCPVSDAHLGAMGVPIKQVVGDKTFYLCCSGCIDEVKEHPDQVVAKLKK